MRYVVVVVVVCCCCLFCSLWVDLTASIHVYILFTSNLKSFVLSLCGNCPSQTIFHTRYTKPFIISLRANDPQAQWSINNNRQIESQMEISHYHHFLFHNPQKYRCRYFIIFKYLILQIILEYYMNPIMRCAGHMARMGEGRGVQRVLVGKPEGKRPVGKPRRRGEDNIKMDLQEVRGSCGNWMELAQDRDRWRALVGTVRNLRVPKMRGIS